MTKLVWGQSGDRVYETGVDRGVLYPKTGPGVPWNGLISVTESSTGGEAASYHFEGIKYLDLVPNEDFQAEIEAFSAPPEFAACDGSRRLAPGLFATQQRRETFGFSYRTKIGNDITEDAGYKLHIVYNGTASPASRTNRTISSSVEPNVLKWSVDTVPPRVPNLKPTAHFVIDSREAHPFVLDQVEDILYGTATSEPRLMPQADLVNTFAGLLNLKIAAVGGAYKISTVDEPDARALMQPVKPSEPDISEQPILWLDSSGGGYVVPKLVTGG